MVNLADEGAFVEFAAVAEWVSTAETAARKAMLLTQYFRQLGDEQLRYAVRYFSGQVFSSRERQPQIGEVTLISAFSILTGAEPALLSQQYDELGDLAEVAVRVLVRRTEPVLSLEDVAIALEQLGRTRGKRRLGWVIRLLERATALEAKYLTQLMLGILQLSLDEEIVEAALAQMVEQPLARIQRVHVLLGDLSKTAVLARHNQLDQARMQVFHPIKFMLASPLQDSTDVLGHLHEGFAIETKYDGIRVQAHIAPADRESALLEEAVVAGIRVALFSRTLQEITASFPDLVVPLAALEPRALVNGEAAGLILDGEIVPYLPQDAQQFLPFAALQGRLDQSPSETSMAAVPVTFVVYDMLYRNGTVLLDHPYQERRAMLEQLTMETPKVRLAAAQQFSEIKALEQQYFQARAQGQEGLMVKGLQSLYRPGRRSSNWLKIRRAIATLDVVVTAVELESAPQAERSSPNSSPNSLLDSFDTVDETVDFESGEARVLAICAIAVRTSASDATLLSVGKVVVAATTPELARLFAWFDEHTLEEFANGRVRLVEPQVVLEVAFERLVSSSRHKSGYLLEQARVLRLRPDKPASEIDTLATLTQLADAQTESGMDSISR
jgi:DNA ligase 1